MPACLVVYSVRGAAKILADKAGTTF